MTDWLLDTNVLSELRRPRPSRKVVDFVNAQPLESLHVSIVTMAEIRFGIERIEDAAQRSALSDWITNDIRPMFAQRVLPISEDIMVKWLILVEEGRKARHTYSQPGLIIAATALQRGFTIVSRDTREFRRAGAVVFDPWTG